ncbi:MAG TPA: uroporphyrinogen-III C-methyltransferase [Nitrospiria bacterium]|nr:uroporphyrinogen-III C-methyltransferase [Nitrospiria bacterium]
MRPIKQTGRIYLIGAGPGDPGLLTIKGKACIEQADVIVYDYLANEEFLRYARPQAERIFAGKKGGETHLGQGDINRLLIEKARRGKIVVRLKGGDPFIFGRGGEEAAAAAAAGIPFEIVPGVTAAVGVPAYAGIPLTHRDVASLVTFVTGHEDPDKRDGYVPWNQLPDRGTLVFFMGLSNLAEIARQLIQHGRTPQTPVAVVRWGTKPEQRTVVGVLENIVEKVQTEALRPPGLIIVGEVVKLREQLNWFEGRPLFGKRILVTRARDQATEFTDLLKLYGADPVEFPTIEIVPPESWEALDGAIRDIEGYHWVIFTSVNGVLYFLERLRNGGKDVRALKGIKLCAIGPRTAQEIERMGIRVDLMPDDYVAEALIEQMGRKDLRDQRILIPRAEVARDVLPDALTRMGARVDVVTAYRTVRPTRDLAWVKNLLQGRQISVITFTSSSTVRNFVEMFEPGEARRLLNSAVVACIGPITAKTAEEHGLSVHILPKDSTIPSLAQAIVEHFTVQPT